LSDLPGIVIDRIERFGHSFATTMAMPHGLRLLSRSNSSARWPEAGDRRDVDH
jgi:hypothetical protein